MNTLRLSKPLVALALLLWLTLPLCLMAQNQSSTNELNNRVTVLEQRHSDLKERLEKDQNDLKENLERKFDGEQKQIDRSQSWVDIGFTVVGILVALFGFILPLVSFLVGYRWFRKEKAKIKQLVDDAEKDRLAIKATRDATRDLSELMKNITLGNFDKAAAEKIANNEEVEPFAREWASILLMYFGNNREGKDRTVYQDTINRFQKLLDNYPDKINSSYLGDIYFVIAYSHIQLGNESKGYDYYNTITILNPNCYLEVWYNKGYVLRSLLEFDKAIESFAKGIETNPNSTHLWNGKGVAFEDKGSAFYTQAKKCYEKALEINPNYELAKNNLKRLQAKMNNENNTNQSPAEDK